MCLFLEEQKENALTTEKINWYQPLSHPTSQRNSSNTSWKCNFMRTTANCSPLLGSGVSLFTTLPLIWGWPALSMLIFYHVKSFTLRSSVDNTIECIVKWGLVIRTAWQRRKCLQYKDAELRLCPMSVTALLLTSSVWGLSSNTFVHWGDFAVLHISDATSCGLTGSFLL